MSASTTTLTGNRVEHSETGRRCFDVTYGSGWFLYGAVIKSFSFSGLCSPSCCFKTNESFYFNNNFYRRTFFIRHKGRDTGAHYLTIDLGREDRFCPRLTVRRGNGLTSLRVQTQGRSWWRRVAV